jgi:hypothetical protein
MMMRLLLSFVLAAAGAVAQVSAPAAGFLRDRAGCLRPVLGVAGSFVLGDVIEIDVISAGFGKTVGFAKTETELLVVRDGKLAERHAAPSGHAVFFMGNDGEIDQVYFSAARELWRVSRSGFNKVSDTEPPQSSFEIQDKEVTFRDGTFLRLPEPVSEVEWLSEVSLVARSSRALYAIRIGAGALQLPQAAQ